MKKKTQIVIQFYSGDKDQARALTELMCRLESGKSKEAGVLLAYRYDASVEDDWVAQVARRFDVDTHRGRRRAYGWPFGPNELWYDTMQWIHEKRVAGHWAHYDTALFMEPDDCPLDKDWISKLRAGWQEAVKPCYVMGHIHDYAAGQSHINGNAMFSLDPKFTAKMASIAGGAPHTGWDVSQSPLFFKWGARNTPLIRNAYAIPTISEEAFDQVRAQGCVMLHGVKDHSALRLAMKKVANPALSIA